MLASIPETFPSEVICVITRVACSNKQNAGIAFLNGLLKILFVRKELASLFETKKSRETEIISNAAAALSHFFLGVCLHSGGVRNAGRKSMPPYKRKRKPSWLPSFESSEILFLGHPRPGENADILVVNRVLRHLLF